MNRAEDEAYRQVARACPAGLASYASGGRWVLQPHLRLLDEALTRAVIEGGRRIIVTLPP